MSIGHLHAPRKLERADDRSAFSSGAQELDEWFRKYSWQNQRAITYVVAADSEIVGYYAICASAVSLNHVPEDFGRARPKDIPCILLARLAVHQRAQGRGLGVALFQDAIARSVTASESIGAAALLVHARDEAARQFYLHHADLLESPVDDLQLVLPMKVAVALLG